MRVTLRSVCNFVKGPLKDAYKRAFYESPFPTTIGTVALVIWILSPMIAMRSWHTCDVRVLPNPQPVIHTTHGDFVVDTACPMAVGHTYRVHCSAWAGHIDKIYGEVR